MSGHRAKAIRRAATTAAPSRSGSDISATRPAVGKPGAPISFTEAMDSPALFGKWFSPPESWAAWRVVAKAIFAEPMMPSEVEVFTRHTGRQTPPTEPASETWLAIGRRGGKGWFSAAAAVYIACLRQHRLKRGELGRVMVLACDRDQAGETFRYISELIDSIPVLAAMVQSRTKESIDLNNGVQITVQTASFRRIRGRKVIAAICDEIAMWFSDERSANPDTEILTALRPSMLGVPGALLLCISSPFARKGTLWTAYRDHYAKDGDSVLVWKASTLAMYSGADRQFLDREFQKDPMAFAAEYGGEFRTDLESYIGPEAVEAVTVKGRTVLPYKPGRAHYAFMDPAGGSGGDSLTLAIARCEGNRSVICRIAEWRPPFSPVAAAKEVAAILREYGLGRVRGDRFSGGTWQDLIRQHGIAYDFEERTKSDLFHDFLPLLNGRVVELLDHRRTINQLLALERTTSKLGKDSIGHPRGGWDDLINSVAGVAVLVAARAARPSSFVVEIVTKSWTQHADPTARVDDDRGIVVQTAFGPERYRDPRGDDPDRRAPAPVTHDVDDPSHRVECRACRQAWRSA